MNVTGTALESSGQPTCVPFAGEKLLNTGPVAWGGFDGDGLAFGVLVGVGVGVGVGEGVGVSTGLLLVGEGDGLVATVPVPLENNKVSNTATATSKMIPTIARIITSVLELLDCFAGSSAAALNRTVGVSSPTFNLSVPNVGTVPHSGG